MIPLVARVLVDFVVGLRRDRQTHRERPRERLGIVHGDLVVDHLRIDAGEPLGETKRRAVRGAADGGAIGEVRGLDDQGVALPMPPRVAHPQLNVGEANYWGKGVGCQRNQCDPQPYFCWQCR